MDLSRQMRSPDLALEPRPDLVDVVRLRARRARRRRTAGTSLLGVAAVALGLTVLPGLDPSPSVGELASPGRTYGIDDATSSVQPLARLNGGDVVAYWDDDELCVAAVRVKRDRKCAPAVSPRTRAVLPHVFRPDESALRVDDRQLVAGLVRPDVSSVRVLLRDGAPLAATVRSGDGFLLPVFSVELPSGAQVEAVEALGVDGEVLGRRS